MRHARMPCLLAVLLIATMAWGKSGVAQSADKALPDEVKRLILFTPDPGQLSFIERRDYRTVIYGRRRLEPKPAACDKVAGVIETVIIDDFGADENLARQTFESQRDYWRQLPALQREKPFPAVQQGVIFELDWRYKEGKSLCGSQVRDTMFRVGGRVALSSEEFWNKERPAETHLAYDVLGRLGN